MQVTANNFYVKKTSFVKPLVPIFRWPVMRTIFTIRDLTWLLDFCDFFISYFDFLDLFASHFVDVCYLYTWIRYVLHSFCGFSQRLEVYFIIFILRFICFALLFHWCRSLTALPRPSPAPQPELVSSSHLSHVIILSPLPPAHCPL